MCFITILNFEFIVPLLFWSQVYWGIIYNQQNSLILSVHLINFDKCVVSCNQHQNQDIEHFHHFRKVPSWATTLCRYSFFSTPCPWSISVPIVSHFAECQNNGLRPSKYFVSGFFHLAYSSLFSHISLVFFFYFNE